MNKLILTLSLLVGAMAHSKPVQITVEVPDDQYTSCRVSIEATGSRRCFSDCKELVASIVGTDRFGTTVAWSKTEEYYLHSPRAKTIAHDYNKLANIVLERLRTTGVCPKWKLRF